MIEGNQFLAHRFASNALNIEVEVISSFRKLKVILFACASIYATSCADQAHAQSGADQSGNGNSSSSGWFSKDQSDIARYPVPMQSQTSQPTSGDGSAGIAVLNRIPLPNGGITTKSYAVAVPSGDDGITVMSKPSFMGSTAPIYPGAGPYGGVYGRPYGWGAGPGFVGPGVGSGVFAPGMGGAWNSTYSLGGGSYIHNSGVSIGAPGLGGFQKNVSQVVIDGSQSRSQTDPYGTATNPGTASSSTSANKYYSSPAYASPAPPAVQAPAPQSSSGNSWGPSGSPFPKDLNKTPW